MDTPRRLFICLNLLWIFSFSAVACLIACLTMENWIVNEKDDLHIGLWNFCTKTRCPTESHLRKPYYLGISSFITIKNLLVIQFVVRLLNFHA